MQWDEIQRLLLHARRANSIARRYFVTNGFDGALTMLGLMVGFHTSADVSLSVAIQACLGAAVALLMSGLSSAYLSESAERKRELHKLEQALLSDLSESDYGKASRLVPVMVALVNGLSPLIVSLLIISPLWMVQKGVQLPLSPFLFAIAVALCLIFLLGVMLGRLSREFWLWAGLRTLMVGGLTVVIVYSFS
jgi:predicted membrane protein (TIGR00267 family)